MRQGQALLQAILDNPDDDTLRLVYADWLEENGDADRAEFIRSEIELAGGGLNSERRGILYRRGTALIRRHRREWFALPEGITWWECRRGFLDEIRGHAAQVVAAPESLFGIHPVRHAWLVCGPEHLGALSTCPQMTRLATLRLTVNGASDEGVNALAVSPFLHALRELDLGGPFGDQGVGALASSLNVANVERLQLDSDAISRAGVSALTQSPYLTDRVSLAVEGAGIGRPERAMLQARFGDRVRDSDPRRDVDYAE